MTRSESTLHGARGSVRRDAARSAGAPRPTPPPHPDLPTNPDEIFGAILDAAPA